MLLKSGQTRDKQPIAYPKTDKPEIISVIGIIEPGGRTPLHEHPVPTYVYILEGEVELQSHGGQPHQYKAGEAYIEALNHQQIHAARRRGGRVVARGARAAAGRARAAEGATASHFPAISTRMCISLF